MVVIDYPVPKPKREVVRENGPVQDISDLEKIGRFCSGLIWGILLGVPLFYLLKYLAKGAC